MDDRRRRWEHAAAAPLGVVAGLFLVCYAVPILWPAAPDPLLLGCRIGDWGAWLVFAGDYLVRLALAADRRAFLAEAWLDLVLILLLLPMFRPLRALLALNVVGRHGFVRGRVVATVAGAVLLVAVVSALGVLQAERGQPGATVQTFGDALWWAAATVTTVGYGDLAPVTTEGRVIALVLMATGIGLVGVVTAALASWFVEKVGKAERDVRRATSGLDALTHEIAALRRLLEEHGITPEAQGPAREDEPADPAPRPGPPR